MKENQDQETQWEELPKIESEDFSDDLDHQVPAPTHQSFEYTSVPAPRLGEKKSSKKLIMVLVSLIMALCALVGVGYVFFMPHWLYQAALQDLDTGQHQISLQKLHRSADMGYASAQETLGRIYYHGEGVTQDPEMAAEWFEKAAVQDNVDAQFALGTLYCQGKGVGQDKQRCKELLLKASDNGHVEAARTLTEWFSNSGK